MASKPLSASWFDRLPGILAWVLFGATFCLLFIGAMVTSTQSGLSVPDWPTTFGHNMFTFPLSGMVGGIFYEHGHRLFASGVGFLTILLCAALWMRDSRRWLKILGTVALFLVILQGVLGGLTVRYQLPVEISSAHAGLAEIFLCVTLWLALATGKVWRSRQGRWNRRAAAFGMGLTALVWTQIMLGAVMRHSFAGLAIPTFPKAFDAWIPPFWSQGILLNFLHTRFGALIVTLGLIVFAVSRMRHPYARPTERRLAWGVMVLLALQITLGILTIFSGKDPFLASLHLSGGAAILASTFALTLSAGWTDAAVHTPSPHRETAPAGASWAGASRA